MENPSLLESVSQKQLGDVRFWHKRLLFEVVHFKLSEEDFAKIELLNDYLLVVIVFVKVKQEVKENLLNAVVI